MIDKRSLRRKRRVVLGMCALYATALYLVAAEIGDALTVESVPPPPNAVVVQSGKQIDIPELSPTVIDRAQREVEESPAFKILTAGVGYEVTNVGPWTTANTPDSREKTELALLGVSFMIRLVEPVSFTNVPLPQIAYDPDEKNPVMPYAEATFLASVEALREVMVIVDTRRSKVVAIVPAPSRPPAPGASTPNVQPSIRLTPPQGYENPFKESEG